MVKTVFSNPLHGAWLAKGNGDVHVYADTSKKMIVIGQNTDYSDHLGFSDLALMLSNDDVTLQYNKDGKAEFVTVDPKLVQTLLLSLLTTVKKMSVND